MALYQPTNVIPSSYTKGTVDAVNDNMEISWQVNGNSAMTAFQIDFYLNDANSTPVISTGKKGITPEEQKQLGLPFYGTDRFGRPQFFTWTPNGQSWEEWSKFQLTNGNEYKYKITQWYDQPDDVVQITNFASEQYPLESGKVYCVPISGKYSGLIYFSVQSAQSGAYLQGAKLFYSFISGNCWFEKGNEIGFISGGFLQNSSKKDEWVEINATYEFQILDSSFLQQTEFNVFKTRAKPTLTLYQTNNVYNDGVPLPNTLVVSIGYFQARYEQEQSDPIRWIRWQVATANNGTVGEILADTGDIYTPTLNYEFNGFFNKQQYAIRAIGESESGQECDSGWIFFNINIENQGQYDGNFTVQCLNKENATLLDWEGVGVIPPTISPQGYEPQISNGSVTLLPKDGDTEYSVTWNKVMDKNGDLQNMNLTTPWTVVWKGEMERIDLSVNINYLQEINKNNTSFTNVVRTAVFNNDGGLLVIGGYFSGGASLWRVSNGTPEYLYDLPKNETGASINHYIDTVAFNPNGNLLVVGGSGGGRRGDYLYSVEGDRITYVQDIIKSGNTPGADDMCFSPDGNYLIVVYAFSVALFKITNNSLVYVKDIMDFTLGNASARAVFNNEGTILIIGTLNGAYQFSVSGEDYELVGKIKANTGEDLEGFITGITFHPNGKLLVISGGFVDAINLYSVENEKITYQKPITKNGEIFPYSSNGSRCLFSSDGNFLVYGGNTAYGSCCYFIVSKYEIDFISNINNPINNSQIPFTINPSDNLLLMANGKNVSLYSIKEQYNNGVQGKILEMGEDYIVISRQNNPMKIKINDYSEEIEVVQNTKNMAIIITPLNIYANFYGTNGLISQSSIPIAYTQQPITSVSIYGGDSGVTVDSVSVYKGNGSNILSLYENPDFEPVWNSDQYDLYMTANFNGNLEGGTGTATGKGFRVYRQEVGKNVLTPIATVPSTTTSVKDYGIVSRKAYKYSLYAYDNNGAFMSAVENEKVIATCFKNYSLLVCDYDEENDEYHVRKQYLFALNLSTGSVGNNNSPTLNANFTRYPTRMPSTQNYASGTLQGLIGAIYTVPALIEQIGNYKWTAKPSTMDYFDSVDLEQELYDLSTAPYQLFLRDMKGRLRMVATNGAITMTTNIKQKQQSISISFPWVEIGDASDVTIIQTPKDYGWNNDNQVLDVSLDVDVATGELSATYPYPYNGTKFYLTGVNKETLTAKTPLGITPAQFNLSETASEPDDGELTATVKFNREDN